MKAKSLLTIAISLSALAGFSQAREVETTMGKQKGKALRIEINEPASKVEKAMQTQLSQTGANPTKGKGKGLYQYKGVKLSPTMSDSLNIYTRVESKGKDKSVVYFAAARPNGEFITEDADSSLANQVKSYLYDFIGTNNLTSPDYDMYQISDSIRMDETNSMKYDEDRKKLEQQRDDITKQMTEMENSSTQRKAEVERRKQRMQDLQNGRSGSPASGQQGMSGDKNSGSSNQSANSNGSTTTQSTTDPRVNASENSTDSLGQSSRNNSSDTSMNKSQSGKKIGTKSKSGTTKPKSQSIPDSTKKQ